MAFFNHHTNEATFSQNYLKTGSDTDSSAYQDKYSKISSFIYQWFLTWQYWKSLMSFQEA